jgi:hypothetical protein
MSANRSVFEHPAISRTLVAGFPPLLQVRQHQDETPDHSAAPYFLATPATAGESEERWVMTAPRSKFRGFDQLALSAVLTTLATLLAFAAATVRGLLLLARRVLAALLSAVTLIVLALVALAPLLAALVPLILIHDHLLGSFPGVCKTVRQPVRSCRFYRCGIFARDH